MFQILKKFLFLTFISLLRIVEATNNDATWVGIVNSDLNIAGNWVEDAVPDGIATFDSASPPVSFTPTASAQFSTDTFYFPNSASDFQFTLTGPGGLSFTGAGITGTNTNTQISATNSTTMMTPQFLFNPCNAISNTYLGSTSVSLTNTTSGTLSFNNTSQMTLGDASSGCVAPIIADDLVTITVTNNGVINATNEGSQIYLNGTSFTAGDNLTVNVDNAGVAANITCSNNTGQLLVNAMINPSSFIAGNNVSFNFNNGSSENSGFITSSEDNYIGQLIFLPGHGGLMSPPLDALLTFGDYATLNIVNQNGSTLQGGNIPFMEPAIGDVAQILFNSIREHGIASFSFGSYTTFNLINQGGSFIQAGRTFNAAQLTMHGDTGTNTFSIGDNSNLVISNESSSSISIETTGNAVAQVLLYGPSSFSLGDSVSLSINNESSSTISLSDGGNGNLVGQMVIQPQGGVASFNSGNYTNISFINAEASQITGPFEAGQLVLWGNNGTASFTTGDYADFIISNESGSNISTGPNGQNAGQIILGENSGTASFVVGDYANVLVSNKNNSTISVDTVESDTYQAGQIILDGTSGVTSFTAGNNLTLNLINDDSSTISLNDQGNVGQLLLSANGGTASFIAGDNANFTVNNGSNCSIQGLDNTGRDVGQIVIQGYNNLASFTLGNNANVSITNAETAQITGGLVVGQLVLEGGGGSPTFTIGNDGAIDVINSGSISCLTGEDGLIAQIPFLGFSRSHEPMILNTGNNVTITATNTPTGTINSAGGETSAAQIYFRLTTINGNPTIKAINQNPDLGAIPGIVFDENSTANNANIVLVNTSLVVNVTSPPPFMIASLTGDSTSVVNLSNDFEINMTNGTNTTFAGIIQDVSGPNNLFINGTGTQSLSGANTFGGSTTVNGGTLALTGSVLHDVTVNSGGVLSGTGTAYGNVIVNDGAQIAPDTSNGIFTIGENYTQTSQASCLIEISGNYLPDGTPESGELLIGGTADLAGTLELFSPNGTYSIGHPYTLLTANAINGTFDQVILENSYLNYQIIYVEDPSVQIILSTSFINGAQTPNEQQVATQIDGNAQPTANEELVINSLLNLSSRQLSNALDEMSGGQYAYLAQTNQFADYRFGRKIFEKVRNSLDPCCCHAIYENFRSWTTFEAGYGVIGGDSNNRGFNEQNFDFTLGRDVWFNAFLVGAAANAEIDNLSFIHKGRNTLYNFQGAIYGSYTAPRFYLFSDLMLGGGYSNFKRTIKFGDIDEKAHSRPQFTHGLFYLEYGYNFYTSNTLVQPFISGDCDYTYAHRFSEHGAESLNLHLDAHTVWASNVSLGSHFSSSNQYVQFNADLAYQHRFGSLGTKLKSRFVDFGDLMSITASQFSRDGVWGNLNAIVNMNEFMDFYVEISGESWGHRYNYAGSIGLDCNW